MVLKRDCQECGATIEVDEDSIPGEIVSCPDCGTEYEVISIDPKSGLLELKVAEEVGEDWGE